MVEVAELIERAKRGDRDVLGMLLRAQLPQLRTFLSGRIAPAWRSLLEEDDIIQVTCLEAFLYIDQFKSRGTGSLLGWLQRIADNSLRDAIEWLSAVKRPDPRRQVRAPAIPQDSYVALFEYLGAVSTTPSREAARHEAEEKLREALEKLPEDYRRVVALYDLDGRGVEDVAAAMQRSVGAVYMMRARAHDRLRELLGTASRLISTTA